MIRALLALAVLGGATATDDAKDIDHALAGRVAGTPARCLGTATIGAPQAIGNRVLLYRDGRRIWRNDLPETCLGLDRDPLIVTEVFGGQLCRGDIIYTIDRGGIGMRGPSCRLGEFTPWDKPKR